MQAIFLYGNGAMHLDRLEFARMVRDFCAAVDMRPEAMLDLLIVLAAVDDRPADELTFLVSLGASCLNAFGVAPGPAGMGC